MNPEIIFQWILPTDETILQQIYHLRVKSRSDDGYISYAKFPQGWNDDIDAYSEHIIASIDNKIVAAGRITFLDSISNHPYYLGLASIIPLNLQGKCAYISRDQVDFSCRGLGIQRHMFEERYNLCKSRNVDLVFIDIPEIGYQLNYYSQKGYINLGLISIDKLHWDLGPSLLMYKMI